MDIDEPNGVYRLDRSEQSMFQIGSTWPIAESVELADIITRAYARYSMIDTSSPVLAERAHSLRLQEAGIRVASLALGKLEEHLGLTK